MPAAAGKPPSSAASPHPARPPAPPASAPPGPIRATPPEERPRQRLLRSGPEALSDPELLALVLGNGCREVCPLALAREVLAEAGGLSGLVRLPPEALRRRGLGEAKAAALLAALDLARRLARAELPERELLSKRRDVARYLVLRYAARDQEVMGALHLDTRHRLLGEGEVFRGTLHRAAVEPRQILAQALLRGAAGVVVSHYVARNIMELGGLHLTGVDLPGELPAC
ncbi:MAG: RadC family protein, partial [Thermoanaerobaculia bacterium]